MKRNFKAAAGLLVLALVIPVLSHCSATTSSNSGKAEAKATAKPAESVALKVWDRAPDFTLPDQDGKDISLSQFHGKKNVVLAFYVLAFTGG